jgi:hypothetical protein
MIEINLPEAPRIVVERERIWYMPWRRRAVYTVYDHHESGRKLIVTRNIQKAINVAVDEKRRVDREAEFEW